MSCTSSGCSNSTTAPQLLSKKAGENRKFTFDFENWLGEDVTVSTISSITSTKIDGDTSDLTITSGTIDSPDVTFFVDAGTAGTQYKITVTITTSDGQTLSGDGMLMVT